MRRWGFIYSDDGSLIFQVVKLPSRITYGKVGSLSLFLLLGSQQPIVREEWVGEAITTRHVPLLSRSQRFALMSTHFSLLYSGIIFFPFFFYFGDAISSFIFSFCPVVSTLFLGSQSKLDCFLLVPESIDACFYSNH